MITAKKSILDQPFTVEQSAIDFYEKNRYIKIKNVLDPETIAYYNDVISSRVSELNEESRPLEERSTYDQAFLQLFNLWQSDDLIKNLVFSQRLASIATQLMEVDGVRLYHDQALFKEPGGGITPWHADQYYWPLSSDKTITAWIPLQATSLEMGPLEFSAGSHNLLQGRELEISAKSEKIIKDRLRVSDFPHIIESFDIGEVSFHSGWVFHRAGANSTNEVRKVMTVIYMDKNMTLKAPENDGQMNDWKTWCPGVSIGARVNSPLNPLLYEKN